MAEKTVLHTEGNMNVHIHKSVFGIHIILKIFLRRTVRILRNGRIMHGGHKIPVVTDKPQFLEFKHLAVNLFGMGYKLLFPCISYHGIKPLFSRFGRYRLV